MSEQSPKLFHENLDRLLDLILQLASGDFQARLPPSEAGTTIDALAVGLNMLAEELQSSFKERESALKSLTESEQKFRAITDTALDAIILLDGSGKVTMWNPAAEKIYGFSPEEVIGRDILDLLAPDEHRDSYMLDWDSFRATGQGTRVGTVFEARARSKHKGEIPVEMSVSSTLLNNRWYAICIVRDITERKAMEQSVAEEREILRVIDNTLTRFIGGEDPRNAFEIVLVELVKLTGSEYGFLQDTRVDEQGRSYLRTLAVSDNALTPKLRKAWKKRDTAQFRVYDFSGLNTLSFVSGDVVIANDPDDHPPIAGFPDCCPAIDCFLGIPLKRGEETIGSIGVANRAGGYDDALIDRLTPFISAIAEIAEANQNEEARRKSEKRTERMANFDELTGLPNRSQFKEQLRSATERANRYSEHCALLLLDLDHFKDVNDTLGHPVGDALLALVGERLTSATRDSDIVARLGGDEFAVLQMKLTDSNDAAVLAQRLIDLISKPFDIGGHRIHTETSIGIALCDPRTAQPTRLFSQADTALYRAKADGRHRYRFHDEQVEAEVRQRVTLIEEMHEAFAEGQFELYYQPQIDTRTPRLVGLEALLRWNHPTRGLLSPGSFIPVAETSGFVLEIEAWVLRQACQQMSAWRAQGFLGSSTVGVNLSPLQFKTAEFEANIFAALEDARLPPQCLELEITERSVAGRPETVARLVERLTAKGIGFSIDDFGTGYSSLQYLKRLAVKKIKVAQGFVSDMMADPGDASIVRAIISLGQELGYQVIAEGVESEEQRDFLQDKGCFLFQGFLFGKPQPVSVLTEQFRKGGLVLPDGRVIAVS